MARQFDVFPSPAPIRKTYPHVIVLQHDSVAATAEVIVAALVPCSAMLASRLNPKLDLLGSDVVLQTSNMAAVGRKWLKRPIANLEAQREQIVAAIDMLFVGS